MKKVTDLLNDMSDCEDIKKGFKQGHYDLESCVMELLDYLYDCKESRYVKNDAIMMFLHT